MGEETLCPSGAYEVYQILCHDEDCAVYDHQERSWKHLNFFQHECYIYGRIPRVKAPDDTVKPVEVPWAMPGSLVTLLFEYNVLNLVLEGISASSAGRHTGICGKRIFRIVKRHVGEALFDQGLSPVIALSVDETSTRTGHHYLTVLADRQAKKVVGIAPSKSQEAFNQAFIAMAVRGAGHEDVRSVTMDLSFDIGIVLGSALPVHTELNALDQYKPREGLTRELCTCVGIEDLWAPILINGLLGYLIASFCIHGV